MKTLWAIAIVTVIVAVYVIFLRAWLKCRPWAKPWFDAVEPIEIALWRKSETILWARFKMFLALLITVLQTVGAFDFTAFLPFIPEQHRWWVMAMPPLALALDAMIQEILRRGTTKPLALVAIQEDRLPPDVKAAVDTANAVKIEAVAVVKEAKAEGAIQ